MLMFGVSILILFLNLVVIYNFLYSVGNIHGKVTDSTEVSLAIYRESVPPEIVLVSPADGHSTTSATVNFLYTVNDSYDVSNCSLIINGAVDKIDPTITKEIQQTFSELFSSGTYTWAIRCSDVLGNQGDSSSAVLIVIAPAGGDTGGRGGGGGGGGGPAGVLIVNPKEFNIDTGIGAIFSREIYVENQGTAPLNIKITLNNLEGIVEFEQTSISLEIGEKKILKFKINSPLDPGIYNGKIFLGSTPVLFALNVETEKSLFDISVDIPKTLKIISVGNSIKAQITLVQIGLKEGKDVTINYLIKDFEGKTYLKESETIAVYDQKSFEKEFQTQNLPVGDYLIGAEVVYSGGVATASSHFMISEKKVVNLVILILVGVATLVLVGMGVVIHKYKKGIHKYKHIRRR